MYSQASQVGAPWLCSEACPLSFSALLPSFTVECEDDLPASCDDYLSDPLVGIANLTAGNGCDDSEYDVFCTMLSSNSILDPEDGGSAFHRECDGLTAKRDSELGDDEYGVTDGALRLYGLSAAGITDSDYFVEDPSAPLFFEHTPNSNSARLTGTLYCRENANQILHLDATFDNEENAVDWLAQNTSNSLLVSDDPDQTGYQLCTIDESLVSVFDLAEGSYLVGDGELSGALALSHMPTSYSKRFQLGEGVNNQNCNYGLSGWFSWEGFMNGQSVSGLTADIVIDLDNCVEIFDQCDEYAEFVFTAIDLDCGRVLTQTARIDRDDTIAPVVTSSPADVTAECDAIPEVAPNSDIVATDNCTADEDIVIAFVDETVFDNLGTQDCDNSYLLVRRWSVTDVCDNETLVSQSIHVQDTTAPELTIPEDYTAECSDDHPMDEASATDTCPGDIQIDEVATTIPGAGAGCYTITREFTATDGCGNATIATQTITIIDTTPPVLTNDPQVTISCDDYPNEIVYASATDNCDLDVTITFADAQVSGGCLLPVGAYLRLYTATDDCGNSATSEQIVTLVDLIAPVLIVPSDYTAECSDTHPMEAATATDNCGTVTISEVETTTPGLCAGDYTITRVFTATDNCGNAASATQTITIIDTTSPEFTSIPADYTAECSDDHPMDDATATDNCGEVTIEVVATTEDGDCAGDYTITRVFTATDDCGNASSATQIITVIDTTSPEFTSIPADYTAECSDDHPMDDATATDNCGQVTIEVVATTEDGDCAGDYTITRVFTATDDCGNA
jgi:hypothetical protein